MGRKSRSENLLNNLPQLQNLIKRDPHSYQEEFVQQLSHFEASLAIFELKPDEEAKEFGELINFLSQVAKCYPKKSTRFPKQLIDLLQKHYPVLNGDLRKAIVQALILLRSRGVVSNLRVMPLFFTLFRCRDKSLRKLLYTHIINDVKLANKGKHRNHKLNKALQGFMYTMITAADAQDKHGEGALAAKKSLDVCVELYRKNIWTDAKAVNVIAQACFSPITKVMMTAVQFFLNPQKRSGDNDESGSEAENDGSTKKKFVNIQMIQHQSNVNKKTKYRTRVMSRVARAHRREQAKKLGQLPASDEEDDDDEVTGGKKKKKNAGKPVVNFDVLSLIHDPQGFVEKLFARVHSSATSTKRGGSTVDRFEVRLVLLKLISRLIGHHQLQLMAFYPFLQRYLQPHQVDVTQILAVLATGTHAFTPPDVLQPLIRAIADNFVADHCSPEVMCAGLNTVRAIATRQPLSVDPDLLNDLVLYRKHKDKGVMMAARSLLALYREVNPEMLHRRDRGREATIGLISGTTDKTLLGFGASRAAEGVDGVELLEKYEEKARPAATENGNDEWAQWEVASSDDESQVGSESEWVSAGNGAEEDAEDICLDSSSDEDSDDDDKDDESEGELGSECDDGESASESEDEDEDEAEEDDDEAEVPDSTPAAVLSGPAKPAEKRRIDMTRFLTNEDFDRIDRLKKRQKSASQKPQQAKRQKADDGYSDSDDMQVDDDEDDSSGSGSSGEEDEAKDYVDDWDILGDYHSRRRRRKATYEERTSTIMAGREGREKFGSSKAKREKEGRSLSNKEKRKTKDYKMIAHKRSVVTKGKRSLVQKRRDLRKHIVKQKKNGF
ncbi:Severe Depolymerization of Actin [Coemansia sp. IMI 209128]|nr:Severe Depolymerization of Actin [Coemansia sp. IMI 209128]